MNSKSISFLLLFILSITGSAQTNVNANKSKREAVTFHVGMHCASCQERIEKAIPMEKGVKDLKVDLDKKEVTVIYNPTKTTVEKLKKAIEELGYSCEKKLPEKE